MPLTQPAQWDQAQFGHANLNNPGRTRRLVSLATALAHQPEPQSHPAGAISWASRDVIKRQPTGPSVDPAPHAGTFPVVTCRTVWLAFQIDKSIILF
ncbi:hypothetical protein CJP16_14220 [Aeromonas sobria]|uniref:Transposase Tn5-like N-terminal domain-containing protein n=1 Tax=Aeromonas sobria TaxID=646 RepID=A0A2N3IVG4_AERSO|nr:transposase DNA-binding-containing protein [Aeromonas sobria]PKQ76185.1 hypothetical protein CJP16_14220 [Aeromonas sobria]